MWTRIVRVGIVNDFGECYLIPIHILQQLAKIWTLH